MHYDHMTGCLKLREREEDKDMAEFLRLKLMPLEKKLKVTQSEGLLMGKIQSFTQECAGELLIFTVTISTP